MLWLGILIIFWACMHIMNVAVIATVGWIRHPADIYRSDDTLSWFNAVFLYILWFISSPIYGVIGFMIWVWRIGRRNKKRR